MKLAEQKTVSFRIPRRLLARLGPKCRAENRAPNNVMREALIAYLEKLPPVLLDFDDLADDERD